MRTCTTNDVCAGVVGQGGLLDTSAFFALAVRRDERHTAARSIQAVLVAEHRQLMTTNFIVAETHALLLGKVGRAIALRTVQEIGRGTSETIRVLQDNEIRAQEILERYDDTDATSFALMERLGISHAFTYDHHFAQFGFQVVGPSR